MMGSTTMTVQVEPDQPKLQEFMGLLIGYMTGVVASFSVMLGDELGLYRASG
jgi:hypothetical protein